VTVKLRFSDFTTKTVRRTLPAATDDEAVFGPVARELLRSAWSPGIGLRLLGIGVSGFGERAEQLGLFGDESLEAPSASAEEEPAPLSAQERVQLVRGIDAVRAKFGDEAVRYGRDLKSPHHGSDVREAADADDPDEL
jgi:DNA polymerase-4